MILSESKRDDLLLPYVQLLNSKGVKCTLGEFKVYMLKKLTSEGYLRNLSLSSNFYLAGAVKYYFNGDLTLNKNLDVYNNGETHNDKWNVDVCTKLNALINVLRNAYIDSIGETFEQPEDFGELSLPKLLRKYNKKIQKELTSDQTEGEETKEVDDGIDRASNVGNNYTFEIIYNYQQATMYNAYTEPGAWCITYGKHHFDSYIRRLGIHYVFFRKNGWENVPRVKGPDWSYEKPQDEYGCSLIAVLQSNTNGEPIYITSRWNHGHYSDDSKCEADHAFTKEEFFQKTGVTDADLQRIFKIWEKDHKKYEEVSNDSNDTVSKEEKLSALRKVKYAQMRMNGGNFNVSDVFKISRNLGGSQESVISGTAKINKGVYWCETTFQSRTKFYFLIDRGKILFDTFFSEDVYEDVDSTASGLRNTKLEGYNNLVVISCSKFIMLYDLRKHSFINIDGVNKFKCIPILDLVSGNMDHRKTFYEVRIGKLQSVLLNIATNQPLRLPNGSYFFNSFKSNSEKEAYRTIGRSNLSAKISKGCSGCFLDFIYDLSSGERYIYNVDENRFLGEDEIPRDEERGLIGFISNYHIPGLSVWCMGEPSSLGKNIYNQPFWVYKDRERISFLNFNEFRYLMYLGGGLVHFSPYDEEHRSRYSRNGDYYIYNFKNNELLKSPNGEIKFNQVEITHCDALESEKSRLLFIKDEKYPFVRNTAYFIFDKKENKFIENPNEFPEKYTFFVSATGYKDGGGVIYQIAPNAETWWTVFGTEDTTSWKKDYRMLYLPGANNSNLYDDSDRYGGIQLDRTDFNANDVKDMVTEIIKKLLNH